jgi:death-on-curing protein
MRLYPTLEETLELHQALIRRFGGAEGVRDMGLLESALFRPQTGYYASIYHEAAALLQSMVMNHPFVDGNKRVGIALSLIFLRMNEIHVRLPPQKAERFIVHNVIDQKVSIDDMAKWLEQHIIS